MKKIFLIFALLSSCASVSLKETQSSSSNTQLLQTIQTPEIEAKKEEIISNIPKATWEKIFFESIDERTAEAGIKSLRKTSLAKDDIEVRIWMGFGLSKLEGFIMNRVEANWSAIYVDADYVSKKWVNRNIKLIRPKSGWAKTWQKLLYHELLTLPDADSINCRAGAKDGFSYVVELKKGKDYRTYMYDNPEFNFPNRCREANQMVQIIKIIIEDFNLKEATKLKQ